MAYKDPSYRHESPRASLPEVESISPIDSAESQHQRVSSNPYFQRCDVGTESLPSGERMKTPIRTVFTDLSAAHSSITSGRSRSSGSGNGIVEKPIAKDQSSIPLQDLNSAKRPIDHFGHVPLPTLPELAFGDQHGKRGGRFQDISFSDRFQTPQFLQPAGPGSSPSVLQNIKSVFISLSSPLGQSGKAEGSSSVHWPRPSPGVDTNPQQQKSSLTEASRNNKASTKVLGNGYALGSLKKEGPNDTNINGSSAHPSSPPIADALHLPINGSLYTYSSHGSESVQYNNTRDRTYYPASKSPYFPDQSHAPSGRKPSHSTNPSEQVSFPDGSTVGNIYNHYLHLDPLEDFSDDDLSLPSLRPTPPKVANDQMSTMGFQERDQTKPSALTQRMQARANRFRNKPSSDPPEFSLPENPSKHTGRHPVLPSSTRLGQPSSYGDTQELLNLPEPVYYAKEEALNHSKAPKNLCLNINASQSAVQGFRVDPQRGQTKNPFNDNPRLIVENVDESHFVYRNNAENGYGEFDVGRRATQRMPLEREVSEALRRASCNDTYSTGSFDTFIDRYRYFGPRPSSTGVSRASRESIAKSSENAAKRLDSQPSGDIADQPSGMPEPISSFYAPGAISPSWITGSQRDIVRIPIQKEVSTSPVLPRVRHDANQSKHHPIVEDGKDDVDDWETVGESGFVDVESGYGYLGGAVKQAGSSIANISDYGSLPDFDDIASSERITQHPVDSRYNAEYRQRDLKNSHIPVFAPVYREHKVNGYLADSSRVRPHQAPHGYAPLQSLGSTHPNPFKTLPPQVMPSKGLSRPSYFQSRRPEQFKPSLQTLCTESESADHADQIPQRATMTEEERREWMQDFSRHKLTLSSENEIPKTPSPTKPPRLSSWQRMMELAADGAIIDFNGTFVTDETKQRSVSASDPKLKSLKLPGKVLADQLAKIKATTAKDSSSKVVRNSLSAIPARSYYQNLDDNHLLAKERSLSAAQRADYRHTSNDYAKKFPTNKLRPLSLVNSQPPSSASSSRSHLPIQFAGSDDYLYRSPLAAPRRASTRLLYSSSRLQNMDEAAIADGFVDRLEAQRQSSVRSDGTPNGGSRRHLFEAPRLRPRNGNDLKDHNVGFSIIVLSCCAMFPPFLILYHIGLLDPLMSWRTNCKHRQFTKKQKRWALLLLIVEVALAVIALVASLAWYFTSLR